MNDEGSHVDVLSRQSRNRMLALPYIISRFRAVAKLPKLQMPENGRPMKTRSFHRFWLHLSHNGVTLAREAVH